MAQRSLEQSVVIDPRAIQHVEMVWFEPRDAKLLSRAERLAGFDLALSRVSLDAIAAPSTDRCNVYLNRRGATARSHGALSEVVLESMATMYGLFAPHLLCLSAWPDERSLDGFTSDRSLTDLREEVGIADIASTTGRLNPAFHASEQPFTMRYNADCVYEMCSLWDREGASAEDRQGFFDAVVPSRTRNGAGPGLGIVPTRGEYLPNLLCLSEWPSLANFAGFVADADHAEVSRKRFVAFTRMDATATRLYTGRAELAAQHPAAVAIAHGGEA